MWRAVTVCLGELVARPHDQRSASVRVRHREGIVGVFAGGHVPDMATKEPSHKRCPACGRVDTGAGLARFELNCPHGPVTLVGQSGFRAAEIAEIGAAVAAELSAMCAKWRVIHG
jgi:hypothetical protein